MSNSPVYSAELAFLQGGGITANFIMANDWTQSELGHPSIWPQGLKQSLSLILANGSPTFVCWGNSHLFFCNDAFKSTAGAAEIPRIGESCLIKWPSLKADLEIVFGRDHLFKTAQCQFKSY